jgi:adenylate cyclase
MLLRLSTVRAKLTALVALSAVVMLAALPVLSWLLHRQLVDEVDDRVTEAERAFQTELDDDIADLSLAARIIANDSDTARAIRASDAAGAKELAEVFLSVYPDIDILLFDAQGRVLAQVGCNQPPDRLGSGGELGDVVAGKPFSGVVTHGCESSTSDAPPAYVIGEPIPKVGGVVVCSPIDAGYLKNSSAKLGLQLALAVLQPGQDHKMVGSTEEFPGPAVGVAKQTDTTIVDVGSRSWAVQRFEPRQLHGRLGNVSMLAALDVTDIHVIVQRNLTYALAILAVAGAISIWFGSALAGVMSNALKSVNTALRRVEQLDYVHVEPIRTGDELEQLASGFNRMVDGLKERDKLRTTFGKYMTAAVMEHLLAGKVSLGGASIRVTILFTDIRSFTTISEKMDPQQLVALLNEYFSEMVGIVMQEDGVVDKYIGDAIMAVFGAPVPKAEDPVNAVRAAVRMRKALEDLNERLEVRGLPRLRTGIGIHTGEVVAGNIGSEKRMEYTVIGDAVNLASRLESNTKELGVNVLVSEDTYELTKHIAAYRAVKEITVKGRKAPVMTYEVLGLTGEPPLDQSNSAAMAASVRPPAA